MRNSMSTSKDSPRLIAAHKFHSKGILTIPIRLKEKAPRIQNWQKLRISEAELHKHFKGDGNIGIILGEPSGYLTDVDLDCEEAIELAEAFLPSTRSVFGRASKVKSHFLYYID